MAYTSLYRKYRPSTFDEMVGQQHIRQTLKNSIKSASIAHAYLFTGTRGTGKTSTAKIFAKAVNCLHPKEDGSPCNECEVCKALSSPNNLDIIELDAASNNSVEDIRDLVEKVKYAPSVGKYKVYIVDEVHMLTKQAFNAFLKTLEEPPEHVIFILATTEVQTIPATILSRCIRFDFRLIPKEELASHLEKIFVKESVLFDKEAALAIAEAGNGSVRDALSIADMVISYCGNKKIEYMLKHRPNPYMSTSSFIERAVTNYLCDNNSFIVPIFDEMNRTIGLFPIQYSMVESVDIGGELYLKYSFLNGEKRAIE